MLYKYFSRKEDAAVHALERARLFEKFLIDLVIVDFLGEPPVAFLLISDCFRQVLGRSEKLL